MRFAEFERRARAVWAEIPQAYKAGVDGLIVERDAHPDPDRPEVFLMGECITEDYPSQYGGPDTIRSAVALYYGSFAEVARDAAAFDWDAEIHETVMHELQHHLEALADEDALGDFDYAVQQNFKRIDGEAFDPLFFRAGEEVAPGLYCAETDYFLELEGSAAGSVTFRFEEKEYSVNVPDSAADVLFVIVIGVEGVAGEFCLVRVRKQGIMGTLRAAFGGGYSVEEIEAEAARRD